MITADSLLRYHLYQAMPLERLGLIADCDDACHAASNANRNGLTRNEVAAFINLPTGRSRNVSHHINALRESDIHSQRATMKRDFLDPPHPHLVKSGGAQTDRLWTKHYGYLHTRLNRLLLRALRNNC